MRKEKSRVWKIYDDYIKGPINPLDTGPQRRDYITNYAYRQDVGKWADLHFWAGMKWWSLDLVYMAWNQNPTSFFTPMGIILFTLGVNNLAHYAIGTIKRYSAEE